MLELYRRAVGEMKARPPWDPTSWWFQANIHWAPPAGDDRGCFEAACFAALFTPPAGADPATVARIEAARRLAAGEIPIDPSLGVGWDRMWAKCPHGLLDFLPWHRLYLHFLERVVESVVGEPFAMPYWNYLDPRFRDMPEPFRAERDAAGSDNHLFYPDRSPLARDPNDPTVPAEEKPLIREIDLQWSLAAEQRFLERGDVLGLGRGFSFQLERFPHDQVHGRIGTADATGNPLGMATTAFAARDPIFWLHHANLDRLWEWWRTRPTGPMDPPRDPTWIWSQEAYRFVGPDARPAGLPAEVALGLVGTAYTYDTLEPAPPGPEAAVTMAAEARPPRTIARSGTGLRVAGGPASVELRPATPGPEAAAAAAAGPSPRQWFLRLEGVRSDRPTAGSFDIYLDPAGTSGPPAGSPAASITFFGAVANSRLAAGAHAAHGTVAEELLVDVTGRVRALTAAGASPAALRITVKPVGTGAAAATVTVESFNLIGR
jgi:tyrosinase